MDRIKIYEEAENKKMDENDKRIMESDFKELSSTDKERYLNIKMKLLGWDLVDEYEIGEMFMQNDELERYSDMLLMIIRYPREIEKIYEETATFYKYNMEYKWDWDLSKLTYMPVKSWIYDLAALCYMSRINKRLKLLLQTKILQKYNMDIVKNALKYYKKIK